MLRWIKTHMQISLANSKMQITRKVLNNKQSYSICDCETAEISNAYSISLAWGQLSVPNLKRRDQKKNDCLGVLREFLTQIFSWGFYYAPC